MTTACLVALAVACKRDAQDAAAKADATRADTSRPDAVNSDAGNAGQPSPTSGVVTFDGLSRARIGSTLAQLREAGAVPDAKTGEKECRILHLDWMPAGTRVMLTNDTLARIDIQESSSVRTLDGAGIGDMETRIHQLYPKVRTAPDKYVPADHDLSVVSPNDTLRQMIFDTHEGKVVQYRVGRAPEIWFAEGCG